MEVNPTYRIIHVYNTPNGSKKTNHYAKKHNKTGKKKVNKKRCALDDCRKKLLLTDCACRCQNTYCQKHRLPEAHSCSVDYKKLDRESFIEKAGLIACIPTKIHLI